MVEEAMRERMAFSLFLRFIVAMPDARIEWAERQRPTCDEGQNETHAITRSEKLMPPTKGTIQ